LLIQALHELGNLLYADGNQNEAEIQWNDCVDTIFQKLYVVKDFRTVFKANPNLADSFGSRNVLIGGVVLTKLAKLCYEGKDLHKFMETSQMAAELFAAPAKLSLPHPQVWIEFANYNFGEFLDSLLPGESSLFTDIQVI
jgi:CTP synthase (UTP-ammonia lyase)